MASSNTFNFTIKSITELPVLSTRYLCHDTHPKSNGLKLEVMTSGKKYFRIKQKLNGKTITLTLGEFGLMTIEEARNNAREQQSLIHQGINPNQHKKSISSLNTTLYEIFEDYLKSRKLSDVTIKGYQSSMSNVLAPLSNKKILDISYEIILSVHQDYSIRSPAEADRAMRLLRAVFNYAIEELKDSKGTALLTINPVKKLYKNRQTHKLDRKTSHLEDDQLPIFIDFIQRMAEDKNGYEFYTTGADLLLTMLFHGTRFNETSNMLKIMVDLKYKRFWLTKTKNKTKLWLPMTSFTEQVFQRRMLSDNDSEYLFPAVKDHSKCISDTKKPLKSLLKETGIKISPHDLRRTFMTIGNRLNISSYTLKQLANHSRNENDVTQGYVIQTADELRPPSQMITDFMTKKERPIQLNDSIKVMLSKLSKEDQNQLLQELLNDHS